MGPPVAINIDSLEFVLEKVKAWPCRKLAVKGGRGKTVPCERLMPHPLADLSGGELDRRPSELEWSWELSVSIGSQYNLVGTGIPSSERK